MCGHLCQQHIISLEVAMDDTLGVHMAHASRNITRHTQDQHLVMREQQQRTTQLKAVTAAACVYYSGQAITQALQAVAIHTVYTKRLQPSTIW